MKSRLPILFLVVFAACIHTASLVSQTASQAKKTIYALQRKYIPDLRLGIFQYTISQTKTGTWILQGRTDNGKLHDDILKELKSEGFEMTDSLIVLPDLASRQKPYGLITLSVANLRAAPSHASEMSTQALLGTPVKVLETTEGWYHIQTPDRYIAWVDHRALKPLSEEEFTNWRKSRRVVFMPVFGTCYVKPAKDGPGMSDLVAGDILQIQAEDGSFRKVNFPDGREGFVPADQLMDFSSWINQSDPSAAELEATARQFLGFPYLWGGTSTKGMDCSGFIKTAWFLHGIILQRDASQQVLYGFNPGKDIRQVSFQPGDLLFFGSRAQNGNPEKVVHVAMVITDHEYIHASGYVRISELQFPSGSPLSGETVLLQCRRYLGHIGENGLQRVRENNMYIIP